MTGGVLEVLARLAISILTDFQVVSVLGEARELERWCTPSSRLNAST